jgi:hypothetical protein
VNASGGKADMHAVGTSDGSVVPANPANKDGAGPSAEPAEERGPAKRNVDQSALHRTPSVVQTHASSRGRNGTLVGIGRAGMAELSRGSWQQP